MGANVQLIPAARDSFAGDGLGTFHQCWIPRKLPWRLNRKNCFEAVNDIQTE